MNENDINPNIMGELERAKRTIKRQAYALEKACLALAEYVIKQHEIQRKNDYGV